MRFPGGISDASLHLHQQSEYFHRNDSCCQPGPGVPTQGRDMEGWMARRQREHGLALCVCHSRFWRLFLAKAHGLTEVCPLATASSAPSVGHSETGGGGGHKLLGEGTRACKLEDPSGYRPLFIPTPISTRPYPMGQGGTHKQPFPPRGQGLPPKLSKPDVPHPSGWDVHIWQAGLAEWRVGGSRSP